MITPPVSLSESAMRRHLPTYLFFPFLAFLTFQASADDPVGPGLVEKEVLPRESLRGYGPVSGVLWISGGGGLAFGNCLCGRGQGQADPEQISLGHGGSPGRCPIGFNSFAVTSESSTWSQ